MDHPLFDGTIGVHPAPGWVCGTVMELEQAGTGADQLVVHDDFASDPEDVAYVRRLVGLVPRVWGLGDSDLWGLETAVGALVSAGPWAGDGHMSLHLHRQPGRVVIEVQDRSEHDTGHDEPDPDTAHPWQQPGGSAARLVDQVADAWGTRTDQHGTAVWLVKHTASG